MSARCNTEYQLGHDDVTGDARLRHSDVAGRHTASVVCRPEIVVAVAPPGGASRTSERGWRRVTMSVQRRTVTVAATRHSST